MATTKGNACPQCLYYQKAKERPNLPAPNSAGEIEAYEQFQNTEAQFRDQEIINARSPNFYFRFEPLFFDWCGKFTANAAILDECKYCLENGTIADFAQKLGQRKIEINIEFARGDVQPIYQLTSRVNKRGDCPSFVDFKKIVELLEFAYSVKFSDNNKNQIRSELINENFSALDANEAIINWMLQMHSIIFEPGKNPTDHLTELRKKLNRVFESSEKNNTSRSIVGLRKLIEEVKPGSTGN